MTEIDTSAEAVERRCVLLRTLAGALADRLGNSSLEKAFADDIATLRALVAERDAARLREAESVVATNNAHRDRMTAEQEARRAEADRDRLAARVAELEGALREMWDSACTNATSTPSKAAFLKTRAALAGSASDDR